MKIPLAFVHASPAAIPPLVDFYQAHAPEFAISNFLDDGLLSLFATGDQPAVELRLGALVAHAAGQTGAPLLVVTCSAASTALVGRIASRAGVDVLKVDAALARQAVTLGPRIGLLVTFAPSRAAAESLLRQAAEAQGGAIELDALVIPEAYEALLAGDAGRHDDLVARGAETLAARGNSVVALSQISMARAASRIQSPVPVLHALGANLAEVRARLGQQIQDPPPHP